MHAYKQKMHREYIRDLLCLNYSWLMIQYGHIYFPQNLTFFNISIDHIGKDVLSLQGTWSDVKL